MKSLVLLAVLGAAHGRSQETDHEARPITRIARLEQRTAFLHERFADLYCASHDMSETGSWCLKQSGWFQDKLNKLHGRARG